jgi:hypothetical protein
MERQCGSDFEMSNELEDSGSAICKQNSYEIHIIKDGDGVSVLKENIRDSLLTCVLHLCKCCVNCLKLWECCFSGTSEFQWFYIFLERNVVESSDDFDCKKV